MVTSGYKQYKENSIYTMTKGELLNLVFDEALKRITSAEHSLKNNNFEIFDRDVLRTKEIVKYLSDTLDRKYPISRELYRIYDYLLYTLSRIYSSRSEKLIQDVKPIIAELRSTFKEADRINSSK